MWLPCSVFAKHQYFVDTLRKGGLVQLLLGTGFVTKASRKKQSWFVARVLTRIDELTLPTQPTRLMSN